MRPRQREPPTDHSRQKQSTKVLAGDTDDDSAIAPPGSVP